MEPGAVRFDHRRVGALMIALGVLGILWGVFHVLGALPSPRPGEFASRIPYDTVKVTLHEAFPGGFLRALGGLALALAGGRLRAPRPG